MHRLSVENYNENRGVYSPLIEYNGIVIGFLMSGNNYRSKVKYFGAYPPNYLKVMRMLFPETTKSRTLHLFSGMVSGEDDCGFPGFTFDIKRELAPDFLGNAENLSDVIRDTFGCGYQFDLILADPAYGENHVKYGTEKVNKKKVVSECVQALRPGGHLAWLDTSIPIFSKAHGWRKLRGTIGIVQSTNHAVRVATILEKVK